LLLQQDWFDQAALGGPRTAEASPPSCIVAFESASVPIMCRGSPVQCSGSESGLCEAASSDIQNHCSKGQES
jgi:hypothetical protein